jgi:hypothetical protein
VLAEKELFAQEEGPGVGVAPYIETARSCPDAVAGSADDGGLVDVAGADEAAYNRVSMSIGGSSSVCRACLGK